MEHTLKSQQDKLSAAEELFFTWLLRVIATAILVGSAWIDDAPPLSLAAIAIAGYVGIRLLMQFKSFISQAPVSGKFLQTLFAAGVLLLLVMSFVIVVIFVERIAVSVVA